MKKLLTILAVLCGATAYASVTIPNVFTTGQTIPSAGVNANFSALSSEVNSHEAAANPHQTKLEDVLTLNNSCGSHAINFNGTQALDMAVENVAADPAPGLAGRVFYNTVTNLLKVDTGSTIVSVAGSGTNNLTSVLNSGNSAGTHNLDMNENQLLRARVENLGANPAPGNAGRLFFNTGSTALMVDTGAAITAIGGSQGLSSVLGTSNSAGSTNIDFNKNQALNLIMEKLAADPGIGTLARIYYDTSLNIPKFYNGSSWLQIGNTNTLAQTMALGASVGSTDLDFNSKQAKHMVLYNNAGSPGTGTPGYIWFDTTSGNIGYETSGANHKIANLDEAQTLTNKSISGSANTLTNIQDSSLSANVGLLSGNQTITGVKTFSTAPKLGSITSNSGATYTVPTGVASDTIALLNATQQFTGKSMVSPTFIGGADFSEGQASHFRVENLAVDPTPGNAGRMYYKTTTGEIKYDDGTNLHVVPSSSLTYVASVGLALPPEFAISNSPVNSAGTLTGAWASELANTFLAAPNGAPGTPSFRSILAADIPTLNQNTSGTAANLSGTPALPDGTTATTQAPGSNDTKLATDAFVAAGLALKLDSSAFSDAGVTGKLITGFSSGAGALAGTDTILQAINKLDGNVGGKQASGNYITALTSDVTASGPGSVAATIAANAVTNAKAAKMAAHTFKGNNTAGLADSLDLTATELTAELNNFGGDAGAGGTKGLVPAPGVGDAAKVLLGSGVWSAPATTGNTYSANNHGVVISGTSTTMTVIAPDASTHKVLTSGGTSADPTWVISFPVPSPSPSGYYAHAVGDGTIDWQNPEPWPLPSPSPSGAYVQATGSGYTLTTVTPGAPTIWSGFHENNCQWSVTSASPSDPAADTSCTFTETSNSGFGTVKSNGNSPGTGSYTPSITFTPSSTGWYWVCALGNVYNSNSGINCDILLTDGSVTIARQGTVAPAVGRGGNIPVCGVYNATSTASKTLKIQVGSNGAQTCTLGANGNGRTIDWTIYSLGH